MKRKVEDRRMAYPLPQKVKHLLQSFQVGGMTANDALIEAESRARNAIASENPPRVELSPMLAPSVWLSVEVVERIKCLSESYMGQKLSTVDSIRVILQLAGVKEK
jgi:hypothetical protein